MKLLHLDLETAPNVVHAWGLHDQNIALNQIVRPSYVLCWAAKWDGAAPVMFGRVRHDARGVVKPESQRSMLAGIHELMMQADALVTYNGNRFDLPKLNGEFLAHGLTPPAPAASIDLFQTARRLGYPSSKLQYVAQALGLGSKVKHEGHGLWVRCMADDEAAWDQMRRYNVGDVRLQERVYRKLRPFIRTHPNHALYDATTRPCCPHCGSTKLKSNGIRRTAVLAYRRYVCLKCGAWSRDARRLEPAVGRRVA